MRFTLNAQTREYDGHADKPLLWVIREDLKLTGTKFGCGAGLCGACTVHLDGEAVRSCSVPVSAVAGRSVTTIEGLARDATHPVQQAWVEHDVPQCGYCQSGMIMSTVAFLKRHPHPTDAQIDAGITNLCRCATYHRVRSAVHGAAAKAARAKA